MPVGADLPPSYIPDEVGYIARLFIIDIRHPPFAPSCQTDIYHVHMFMQLPATPQKLIGSAQQARRLMVASWRQRANRPRSNPSARKVKR